MTNATPTLLPRTGKRPGASLPLIVLTLGFTALWCVGCFVLRPDERPHQFFREGSPVDLLNSTWLLCSALLTWCAWLIASGSPLRRFWLVVSIGVLFLAMDERFQFHEMATVEFDRSLLPSGLRNWSDLLVLLYGVAALALVLPVLPDIWKERRLLGLGILAFILAATSTGIDSIVSSSSDKDIVEETFKVLSGAAIFLTCVEAWGTEVRHRGNRPRGKVLPSTGQVLLVFVACGILAWVTLGGSDRWHYLVSRYWGSAHSWVVCVLLWSSALLIMLGWFQRPARSEGRVPFWLLLAVFLAFLGVGEGVRATRIQVLHDRILNLYPGFPGDRLAVLHDPFGAASGATLLLFAFLVAWGLRLAGMGTRGGGWLLAGAVLLPAALVVNVVGGDLANDIYAPIIRIAGGACMLLGAVGYLDAARGGSPEVEKRAAEANAGLEA